MAQSAACRYADNFQTIALRYLPEGPFIAPKRLSVVLDDAGASRQSECLEHGSDIQRPVQIPALAIDR